MGQARHMSMGMSDTHPLSPPILATELAKVAYGQVQQDEQA